MPRSGTLVSRSRPLDEAQDKKPRSHELDHPKPKNMIHSHSAGSLSTTDSVRTASSENGSSTLSSWHASSCDSADDRIARDCNHWLYIPELDSTEDCLVPAGNSAAMGLQRTTRSQEQVRRWVSTAMNGKIVSLEKELESRSSLDSKSKQQKDTLDRQRSQAQSTRLQNMEERHKKQHDVYEEAQRIVVEKQRHALAKMQTWDEQVQAVLCDRDQNHQFRKGMQQVACHAMKSLNDEIHLQQVHSEINTQKLRDHMTGCLGHEVFDPIPVKLVTERTVSSPCVVRSSRPEHSLNSSHVEHMTPTPHRAKARGKSPQYRYRPISALVPKSPSLSFLRDDRLIQLPDRLPLQR